MSLQQALVDRAADITGGLERLASQIRVEAGVLHRWRAGQLKLPDAILLELVDIVLKDDVARARADRRQFARTHALPDDRSFAPPWRARAAHE